MLFALGYPEQARARLEEALAYARELGHPYTMAYALSVACILRGRHKPGPGTGTEAQTLITFAANQGFPLPAAVGTVIDGWAQTGAQTDTRRTEDAIARMRRGIADYLATGAELWVLDFLPLVAQAYGQAGQPSAGLELLAEALDRVERTGGRWLEAELHRLQGELLTDLSDGDAAMACFRRAIAIARVQGARMWELRAATSLARLWQHQGGSVEARDLLASTYSWFTEGFDTSDLVDAKALLDGQG